VPLRAILPNLAVATAEERLDASVEHEAQSHTVWTPEAGRYYKPLVIQEVCLKCHGDPAAFSPELTTALRELYPTDQATG
jgi:hypothetical protein